MAKNDICRISNCKNRITHKGTVCGTHKWRMKKFNSYDLSSHQDEANYYIPFPDLPTGILKICKKHGQLKTDEVYPKYYKNAVTSYNCKPCLLDTNIKRKYKGMNNLECYEELLKKQNGVCAMCKGQNNTTRNGKIKRFNIDHNHKTLEVRGLLCSFCNSLLGYAKDSVEILESAQQYLIKHKI